MIEELISKLSPEVRDRARAATDVEAERLLTPSIKLNRALGGGLGYGRMSMIWGNKAAAKSSMCLQIIAEAQKEGKSTALFDIEGAFDSPWAKRLGVDTDNLIYTPSSDLFTVIDDAIEMILAGVDVVVLDSITAMVPSAYVEDGEIKPMEKTGRQAAMASDMSKALTMLNRAMKESDTALIMVSQVRMKNMGAFWMAGHTGGQSIDFYCSQVIKLFAPYSNDSVIDGERFVRNKILNVPVGRKIDFEIRYNKLGPPGGKGTLDFYFDADKVGFDQIGEVVDLAVDEEIVKKGGSWYTYSDERVQGRDNFVEFLRDNEEIYESVRGELLDE